ncbi:RbtT/DalT/CsbX family MFS transporter, partial [Enterobacter hormaechei]
LGFTPAEASFAFTLYGLAAALSAWISGVVAEIITPQKTMLIGFVLWCVFHVLFLVFGLGQANYALILLFYGIRGLAYPLFLYAFIVVIIHNVRSDKSSSALGWYWAVYSVGIGVAGSYIPSFTIPHIGEMGTLWLALAFCLAGGIIAMVSLRSVKTPTHMHNLSTREKFAELGRAATLLYTNRSILLSSMVRIINTLSLFGFAVIMPMMFVDELGFTTSEWLQVWAVFFFTTIFSNVFWGVVAEKMGWMRVVRWFGCIGMALSSLAFYYIPQHFGHNFAMALVPAIALGIFVAAFVPMAAVFPALEPRHKGAAISVYNLSAGLSNFLAPAIAVVLLPWFSTLGVVIAYTVLYLLAFVLCAFIRVTQPGLKKANSSKRGMAGLLNTPHPETLKE